MTKRTTKRTAVKPKAKPTAVTRPVKAPRRKVTPVPPPVVAPDVPETPAAPVEDAPADEEDRMPELRVRFRDEDGRPLYRDKHGEEVAERLAGPREPTIQRRTGEGLSNFVAERQDADGDWIYRRVGIEREA